MLVSIEIWCYSFDITDKNSRTELYDFWKLSGNVSLGAYLSEIVAKQQLTPAFCGEFSDLATFTSSNFSTIRQVRITPYGPLGVQLIAALI